jgi:hypothetical protein
MRHMTFHISENTELARCIDAHDLLESLLTETYVVSGGYHINLYYTRFMPNREHLDYRVATDEEAEVIEAVYRLNRRHWLDVEVNRAHGFSDIERMHSAMREQCINYLTCRFRIEKIDYLWEVLQPTSKR